MERQPYPPPGSYVAKNSQRPASVEIVQGGVPPYGVKETLVVNGGKYLGPITQQKLIVTNKQLCEITKDNQDDQNLVNYNKSYIGVKVTR